MPDALTANDLNQITSAIVTGAIRIHHRFGSGLRQVRTYLELADCRVGLLLNFGAPLMRTGIHRVVKRFPDQ